VGKNIVKVAAGQHHSIFLDIFGTTIWTCGRNDYGTLGITDTLSGQGDFEKSLTQVSFDEADDPRDNEFSSIAAGDSHSLAVTRTGKMYSWGFGESGALGTGFDDDEPRPILVTHQAGAILEAAGGSQHTIVLVAKDLVN